MHIQSFMIATMTALTLVGSGAFAAAPPESTTPPAHLLAATNAQGATVIVDFSTFYREKFNSNLGAYINANPLEQQHGAETARVWTEEQMPSALQYSRDGGAWSEELPREGNRFIIPHQPSGFHSYTFKITSATGKGIYYSYTNFKPTLKDGEKASLEVSKQSFHNWKSSKKITFKICAALQELNPRLVTGNAKAIIDDQEYAIGKNGRFTADIEFAPAQTLLITIRNNVKGQEGGLDAEFRDFEASPQTPDLLVIQRNNIYD